MRTRNSQSISPSTALAAASCRRTATRTWPALAAALACALLPLSARADSWTPSAELGLVVTTGNSDNFNLNGKIAVKGETDHWLHAYHVLFLRNETDDHTTANRYEFSGRSGYKLGERSYIFGSLRYENDDFSAYDYQSVASIGYGFFAIKDEAATLLFEIGPGYRRAEPIVGDTQSGAVARGLADWKYKISDSAELFNTLLIEAGSDNTFAQDDLGIGVKINASFALKAGFQVRYNTDVLPGLDKTDTLTTVNLVWSPK
jgi:putative salt-induced outer membrane protein